MPIPDQSHLEHVSQALWRQTEGGATVMVGAGFSRNAKQRWSGARPFPLWAQVTDALCRRLYPESDAKSHRRALTEAAGTSGFLRLAQEYEAGFGRGAMHALIRELVPDEDYVPGELHVRLLSLPWRDVFTTNWDTLLERTRPFVHERAYGVIRTAEELPLAARPRVVKLHGSFPAHIPFVFTEEDYRTYPKRSAQFVNTVQQAMMETVFCLIGFSGDDPNFLHWSGWVRDNLGEHAPKIYLAGWLDLSPQRRRMLEARNVVPIDVARHPQAHTWPELLRHQLATEWIISSLEETRPYDVTKWPRRPESARKAIPSLLSPVICINTIAPQNEPERLAPAKSDPPHLAERVRELLKIWEHNRKIYPGWLLLPPDRHLALSMQTGEWESWVLRSLSHLSAAEEILALRELIWRHEIALEPLPDPVFDAAASVLTTTDISTRTLRGVADPSHEWRSLREAFRTICLALLTAARQRFDDKLFARVCETALLLELDHPEVRERVRHEQILQKLAYLDYRGASELLSTWSPVEGDAIWLTRKAALCIETGDTDRAVALITQGLNSVRESGALSFGLSEMSREGWMLWLGLALSHAPRSRVTELPDAFARWEQLAPRKCDARTQKFDFLEALLQRGSERDTPLFDLGARRGKSVNFSNEKYARWLASNRIVRLSEVAGLPPSFEHVVVMSDLLCAAAEKLADDNFGTAASVSFRSATSEGDKTFNRVWTRKRIASRDLNELRPLVTSLTELIELCLQRSSGSRTDFWTTRLRVACEALSRLIVRLPSQEAEGYFARSLRYYVANVFTREIWLFDSLAHLMARSWEAISPADRPKHVLSILRLPITGMGELKAIGQRRYPEPADVLDGWEEIEIPSRTPDNEHEWQEIIKSLLRAISAGGDARRRSCLRLLPICVSGRLSASEYAAVADVLWADALNADGGTPRDTGLYDWVSMLMPEAWPGLAESRFREKWLSGPIPKDLEGLAELIFNIGQALSGLKTRGKVLEINDMERERLGAVVLAWSQLPVKVVVSPELSFFSAESAYDDTHAIAGLRQLLRVVVAPLDLADAVFERVRALDQGDTPAYRLVGFLAASLPDRFEDCCMELRTGLASDRPDAVNEAFLGLRDWLVASLESESRVPEPPSDLVREVGLAISTRRKQALFRALQVAQWLFEHAPDALLGNLGELASTGLAFLQEELRYDRRDEDEVELDVPLLRWACVNLALAMVKRGFGEIAAVSAWVDASRHDPLPEVRNAGARES